MSDIDVEVVGSPSIEVEVNPVGAPGAPGPSAVSTDPGNAAVLGGDGLIYVPETGGGGGSWGEITGTLSDQTDLQAALDAKADTADLGTAAAADTGDFAAAVHAHTASQVTDFDAEVSNNTDVAANTATRHTHANASVLNATTASFTTADETKLDGIASGATANSTDAALRDRSTHTGTQSADTLTDGTTNKAFLATERTKLSGIATGATANDTDANLKARANHTGTQSADTVVDGTTNKAYTATEKTKLSGIATGATANDTDANLKNRANHTGTQLASTISDFSSAAFPAGSANNPHTSKTATRNSTLTKNIWQYTGTAPTDNPTNWVAGDEWISA